MYILYTRRLCLRPSALLSLPGFSNVNRDRSTLAWFPSKPPVRLLLEGGDAATISCMAGRLLRYPYRRPEAAWHARCPSPAIARPHDTALWVE